MADRLALQAMLETLKGDRQVYFQPPASVQMKYPAIVYKLNTLESLKADDQKYRMYKSYTITYIHKDPDDPMADELYELPLCRFDRRYISDNLYHDVFTLYY